MAKLTRRSALLMACGTAALAASCTARPRGGMEGSRAQIYSNLADLAENSALALVGKPTTATIGKSGNFPVTLWSFEITQALQTPALGRQGTWATDSPTGSVTVAQFGTAHDDKRLVPLLQSNRRYLLFLRPSGLNDARESWFYIVGGDAGIFVANRAPTIPSTGAQFTRMSPDGPDNLPAFISEADVTNLK